MGSRHSRERGRAGAPSARGRVRAARAVAAELGAPIKGGAGDDSPPPTRGRAQSLGQGAQAKATDRSLRQGTASGVGTNEERRR